MLGHKPPLLTFQELEEIFKEGKYLMSIEAQKDEAAQQRTQLVLNNQLSSMQTPSKDNDDLCASCGFVTIVTETGKCCFNCGMDVVDVGNFQMEERSFDESTGKETTRYRKKSSYKGYNCQKNFNKLLRWSQGNSECVIPDAIMSDFVGLEKQDMVSIMKEVGIKPSPKIVNKIRKVQEDISIPTRLERALALLYGEFLHQYEFVKLNGKKVIQFNFVMHYFIILLDMCTLDFHLNVLHYLHNYPKMKGKANNDRNFTVFIKTLEECDWDYIAREMPRIVKPMNSSDSLDVHTSVKEDQRKAMVQNHTGYLYKESVRKMSLNYPQLPLRMLGKDSHMNPIDVQLGATPNMGQGEGSVKNPHTDASTNNNGVTSVMIPKNTSAAASEIVPHASVKSSLITQTYGMEAKDQLSHKRRGRRDELVQYVHQ